ncbi:MAG: DUF835 domain-containing protein [Candidatus Thermoplasmatota archaeon]|nr:DUF835 domain-containing protein [Candidatus Thermoplasmatota archaeon]
MELRRDSVYLYDFTSYDQFVIDLEIIAEVNPDYDVTILSRLPTRRWIEKIDLSKINNYWITNTDNENSIKPHIDEVMNIISQGDNKSAMIYFLDGLEQIYSESDEAELLVKLTGFSDLVKHSNYVLVICVNDLAYESQWFAKLRTLTQKITIKPQKLTTSVENEDPIEVVSEETIQHELGVDGGPRLAYLAKLPKIGFTKDILVKRILQWRRMGLDVSAIEPALSQPTDSAYELYKLVEEDVRRATELERFIHSNEHEINASQLAVDMFRIRQLTGLDELERKYYSLS